MPITFEKLQELLKAKQLKFFIAPDAPLVRLGAEVLFGTYEVVLHLQDEGRFLQFRTVAYHTCPKDHPNLAPVMRLLAEMNSAKRLVKFGWDPGDGEIMAYADIWLMDNTLTYEQFERMMDSFMRAIDLGNPRVRSVLDTGKDPGEIDPVAMMAKIAEKTGGAPAGPRDSGASGESKSGPGAGGGGKSGGTPNRGGTGGDGPSMPQALRDLLDRLRGEKKPGASPTAGEEKITGV